MQIHKTKYFDTAFFLFSPLSFVISTDKQYSDRYVIALQQ